MRKSSEKAMLNFFCFLLSFFFFFLRSGKRARAEKGFLGRWKLFEIDLMYNLPK